MKKILIAITLILGMYLVGCDNVIDNSNSEKKYDNISLDEYRGEIEELYSSLKYNYGRQKENNNKEEWKEFEKEFTAKLSDIKEKAGNTQLDDSIKNLQDLYDKFNKDLKD